MKAEIKKRYNIEVNGYGGLVKEIQFTLKKHVDQRIVVVFKRTDMDEPLVFRCSDFYDKDFEDYFIELAKSLVIWYNDEP